MDLNKAPEMYAQELNEERGRIEEEYKKKKEIESNKCYGRGGWIYLILGIIGFIVWVIVVNDVDYEYVVWAILGVPAVFIAIGFIIENANSKAAFEEIKQKHKVLDAEKDRKLLEINRKFNEYEYAFEKEIYEKSIEMQKHEVVDELCDLVLTEASQRINMAERSKQEQDVIATFGFSINLHAIYYYQINIMEYKALREMSKTFNELRVRDLPDYAKAEILARAVAEKAKRRLEYTFPRDPQCGTPVRVEINRNGGRLQGRVYYSVVYSAPNSNYMERRSW